MSTSSVSVGQTDFPLRPCATDHAAVPPFTVSSRSAASAHFRLLDGPPYANGAPHLGHVLNKHLKDVVARAATALGHDVEWRPGWDCHGLPLELAVEKQGAPRAQDSASRKVFVAAARHLASSQAQAQSNVFQAQGWSADWASPWHTQDPSMEAGTLRVLADLLDLGLLDVRFAAVPWCPACASTLSNAEQEEKLLTTTAWLVPFVLDNDDVLLSWTTTPWTLPLHRALVVNPQAMYVALDTHAGRAWVSQDTAKEWAGVLSATTSPTTVLGCDLVGREYSTPWSRGVVASDEAVLASAGTGVLHAVPGLSDLDTELGRLHRWKLVQHLAPNGRVTHTPCADQEGLPAGPKASAVVRPSYAQSPWFRELPYQTEHPHCWRHHVPLLTRPSRQVFLRLDPAVRARADAMVHAMDFTPEASRARLLASMKNRPDWCLSRQRTWGVPLALFLDRETGQPHPEASTWMRRVATEVALSGVEAWWDQPSNHWFGDGSDSVDHATLDRVDDVLDVWFDSGCVPQLLGAADIVVEGTDQHRGWFQSCVWVAAALGTEPPFRRVATHGFVLGMSGEKLSKSKGGDANAKSAQKLPTWSELPTDVVRVWALSGTEGHDKVWTADTVRAAQGCLSRWRGVVRFLLANTLPNPSDPKMLDDMPSWDRYWWHRCNTVADQVLDLCVKARVGESVALLQVFGESFSSLALGSWKDRLYCAPSCTKERQMLDLAVRGCLVAWGKMLEVMAPRLRHETQSYWPSMDAAQTPYVSPAEAEEVERVVRCRVSLGSFVEALAQQKGGSGTRRLAGLADTPKWQGQLLADALDVGQYSYSSEGLDPVRVVMSGQPNTLYLGRSPDPVCPRCRRAQPAWPGDVCVVCEDRLSQV